MAYSRHGSSAGTGAADLLGPALPFELFVLALERRRGKEHRWTEVRDTPLGPATSRRSRCALIGSTCAHQRTKTTGTEPCPSRSLIGAPFAASAEATPGVSGPQEVTFASTRSCLHERACLPRQGLELKTVVPAGRRRGRRRIRGGSAASAVPVIAGATLLRLDLEQQTLDLDHPHGRAGRDRRGPVGAGPPQRPPDPDHAVGIDRRPPPRPSRRSSTPGRWSGVEKRVRTIAGMPASMNSEMPPIPTSRVIHDSDKPS